VLRAVCRVWSLSLGQRHSGCLQDPSVLVRSTVVPTPIHPHRTARAAAAETQRATPGLPREERARDVVGQPVRRGLGQDQRDVLGQERGRVQLYPKAQEQRVRRGGVAGVGSLSVKGSCVGRMGRWVECTTVSDGVGSCMHVDDSSVRPVRRRTWGHGRRTASRACTGAHSRRDYLPHTRQR
jgi:hypothetical protein